MNILLLSNNFENSTLATKILASHHSNNLFVQASHAAANTAGTTVSININDFSEIEAFCIAHKVDMVIIHHQQLLQQGLYNFLNDEQREWKGIVTGCSKNFFQHKQLPVAVNSSFISDGKHIFCIEQGQQINSDIEKNILNHLQQNTIHINGFITTKNSELDVCISNEGEILGNLETDLVSIFVAAYNGTFEDVNIEFTEK